MTSFQGTALEVAHVHPAYTPWLHMGHVVGIAENTGIGTVVCDWWLLDGSVPEGNQGKYGYPRTVSAFLFVPCSFILPHGTWLAGKVDTCKGVRIQWDWSGTLWLDQLC